jgi:type VI secretion system protein ImpG
LYNLPKLKENHLIIDSIKNIDFSLTQKLIQTKPFPLFVRGVKVNLAIDSQVFRGHSLYVFSQLLSHVFNLKVQMNSYVDIIVSDANTQQELYQCVQNVGGKMLL